MVESDRTVHETPSRLCSTRYPVSVVVAGCTAAVQDSPISVSPTTARRLVGTPRTTATVTETGEDGAPGPALLVATTEKRYVLPGVRSTTMAEVPATELSDPVAPVAVKYVTPPSLEIKTV